MARVAKSMIPGNTGRDRLVPGRELLLEQVLAADAAVTGPDGGQLDDASDRRVEVSFRVRWVRITMSVSFSSSPAPCWSIASIEIPASAKARAKSASTPTWSFTRTRR